VVDYKIFEMKNMQPGYILSIF